MAYSVTVWFDNEFIEYTRIYNKDGYLLHEGQYGDDTYYIDNYSGKLQFEAIPAKGCKFDGWTYWLGSDPDEYTTEDKTFIHDGDDDIQIGANGSGPPYSEWNLTESDYGFIDDDSYYNTYMHIRENNLFCYRVVFRSSGEANFYTDNFDSCVVGWVSTTDTYDAESGIPYDYIEEATSGGVVYMWCDVEAGVPYYVWIRGETMYENEYVMLTFVSPPVVRPNDFEWDSPKVQYGEYNLTAKEWNAFTKNINEVRAYNYVENYEFDVAYPGYDFTADMYNQAKEAIEEITGSLNGDALVAVSGEPVTAYMLNYIVDNVLNTL